MKDARYNENKNRQYNYAVGTERCVNKSVWAGVCLSQISVIFAGELAAVHISKMSGIWRIMHLGERV